MTALLALSHIIGPIRIRIITVAQNARGPVPQIRTMLLNCTYMQRREPRIFLMCLHAQNHYVALVNEKQDVGLNAKLRSALKEHNDKLSRLAGGSEHTVVDKR